MAASAKQYNKQLISDIKIISGARLKNADPAIQLLSADNNTGFNITNGKNTMLTNGQAAVETLGNYADDTAAAAGSVGVGEWYVNSSTGAITQRLV